MHYFYRPLRLCLFLLQWHHLTRPPPSSSPQSFPHINLPLSTRKSEALCPVSLWSLRVKLLSSRSPLSLWYIWYHWFFLPYEIWRQERRWWRRRTSWVHNENAENYTFSLLIHRPNSCFQSALVSTTMLLNSYFPVK